MYLNKVQTYKILQDVLPLTIHEEIIEVSQKEVKK